MVASMRTSQSDRLYYLHPALRIALLSTLLTGIWVGTADVVFDRFFAEPEESVLAKVPYYLFEVVPTAFLLFYLLRRELAKRERIAAAHKASRRRLANILDTDADAIIGIDKDRRIFLFNKGAERIFGYSAQEIRSRSFDELFPSDESPARQPLRQQVDFTPESISEGPIPQEVTARRKDGTMFPAELRVSRMIQNGNLMFTAVLQDVSRRKTAEEALRKSHEELELRVRERTRELDTLLDMSRQVASTLEVQTLLNLVLSQLKIMVDYTGAAIFVPDGGEMTIVACQGSLPPRQRVGQRTSLEEPPGFQPVLQRRQPVIIEDLCAPPDRESGAGTVPAESGDPQTSRSWMGVPMLVKDKVIGLLQLNHCRAGYFTREHAQLALAIANQAAVALENCRLYQEAQKVAALEERQRLARELHDSVSQALHGIALGVHSVSEMLERQPGRVRETLDDVLRLARSAVTEMRCLIFDLRPDSLESEGLVMALNRLVEAARARCKVSSNLEGVMEPRLSLETKEALYRACREALWNAAKHARADTVTLALSKDDDHVVLEVSDNGIGFDPDGSFPGHFGLQSMRERAASVGGVLHIESVPWQGTRVRIRVPSEATAHSASPGV
jgi:PAS domain S-box-containing protein